MKNTRVLSCCLGQRVKRETIRMVDFTEGFNSFRFLEVLLDMCSFHYRCQSFLDTKNMQKVYLIVICLNEPIHDRKFLPFIAKNDNSF